MNIIIELEISNYRALFNVLYCFIFPDLLLAINYFFLNHSVLLLS